MFVDWKTPLFEEMVCVFPVTTGSSSPKREFKVWDVEIPENVPCPCPGCGKAKLGNPAFGNPNCG